MALDQVTERLLKQYGGLKRARTLFQNDTSTSNTQARELIRDPTGLPLYSASPGLAARQLGENIEDNLTALDGVVNVTTYKKIKKDTYDKLPDEGRVAAYLGLVSDYEDLREGLKFAAIKRVAVSAKLDAKLIKKDRKFASKTEEEKVVAYLDEIQKDDKLNEQLSKDKAVQLYQAVSLYDTINKGLASGKVDDVVDYLNRKLDIDLPALYRAEGNVAAAKATVQRVAMRQVERAARLMKENKSLAKDVEDSIAKAPNGYARAAGEFYAAKR